MVSPVEIKILKNQINVLGYSNGVVGEMMKHLANAADDLTKKLQTTKGQFTRAHQSLILQETTGTLAALSNVYNGILTEAQETIIKEEYSSISESLIQSAHLPLPEIPPSLPFDQVAALVSSPVGGKPLSAWIDNHISYMADGIKSEMTKAIVGGAGTDQAAKMLKDNMGLSRRGANVIARTTLLDSAHKARVKVYDDNDDIIKSYTFLATLDSRTCPVCGPYDGLTLPSYTQLPAVPRHAQCRCIHRPNTRFYEPELVQRPVVEEATKKTTNHKDGSKSTKWKPTKVSFQNGNYTWNDFFQAQPDDWQQMVLGKTKWQMWKAGEISLDDLAKDTHVLSINDLKKKHEMGFGGIQKKKPGITAPALEKEVIIEEPTKIGWGGKEAGVLETMKAKDLDKLCSEVGIPNYKQGLYDEKIKVLAGDKEDPEVQAILDKWKAKKQAAVAKSKGKKALEAEAAAKKAAEEAAAKALEEQLAAEVAKREAYKAKLQETLNYFDNPDNKQTEKMMSDYLFNPETGKLKESGVSSDLFQKFTSEQKAKITMATSADEMDKATALAAKYKKIVDFKDPVITADAAALDNYSMAELSKLMKEAGVTNYKAATKSQAWELLTTDSKMKAEELQGAINAQKKATADAYAAKKKAAKEAAKAQAAQEELQAAQQAAAVTSPTVEGIQAATAAQEATAVAKVDESWEEILAKKNTFFTGQGQADVSGVHKKFFYTDPNGDKWLFKPNSEEFRAYGDEVAYKLGRLIDERAQEVRVITLDGKTGSIQKMAKNLKNPPDYKLLRPEDLGPEELAQIQREHVIDWFISNHDSHSENFIREADGHVLGIDKGQLYKYLTNNDRLDINYSPNMFGGGQNEQFYHVIAKRVKAGTVKLDPANYLPSIQKVEAITNEQFKEIVRPYVERRAAFFSHGDPAKAKQIEDKLYQAMIDRKNSVRGDFEKYVQQMTGKPFKFSDLEAKAPKAAKVKRLAPEHMGKVAEAKMSGAQGKSLPFDGLDIEDQELFMWEESFNGQQRAAFKLKVREESTKKILDRLSEINGGMLPGANQLNQVSQAAIQVNKKGYPIKEDKFFNSILNGVKTINHHAGDGVYNQDKINQLKTAYNSIKEAMSNLTITPELMDQADMLEEYKKWCEAAIEAMEQQKGIVSPTGELFKQYLAKNDEVLPAAAQPAANQVISVGGSLNAKIDVSPFSITMRKYKQGGALEVTADVVETSQIHVNSSGTVQYNISFDDGTIIRWRPFNLASNDNLYAMAGEAEVYVPGGLNPNVVENTLEKLAHIGIDSKTPSYADQELVYLLKQGKITKKHILDEEYKGILKEIETLPTSEEKVKKLVDYWNEKLKAKLKKRKIKDIHELPTYNPLGKYQTPLHNPAVSGSGRRIFERFDFDKDDLDKELEGYKVYHHLFKPDKIDEIKNIFGIGSREMAATVDKIRSGVPIGGMSPQADINTGGANYVFTRLRKETSAYGMDISFKKEIMLRMDAVHYKTDYYGRSKGSFVDDNRLDTLAKMKSAANVSDNELNIKNSINFYEYIDEIYLGNQSQKEQAVKILRDNGIFKMPDGRDIEEVFKVR
jgi:SPP1 gp7 family putative phage head morphogenesis protein